MLHDSSLKDQILKAVNKKAVDNFDLVSPVLVSPTGSRFLGHSTENSDYDFDVIWKVDPTKLRQLCTRLPFSLSLYMRSDSTSNFTVVVNQYLSRVVSIDSSAVKSCSNPDASFDIVAYSAMSVADILIGKNPPLPREQTFILSLLTDSSYTIYGEHESFQKFRSILIAFLTNSDSFIYSLDRFWDRYWQLLAKPSFPYDVKRLDIISDFDFSARTEMFESLNLITSIDDKLGYDLKRSALMLSLLNCWNSFFSAEDKFKGWSVSEEEIAFVRSIRRGEVPYILFASKRNEALEKLRRTTFRIPNQQTQFRLLAEFFEAFDGLPSLT
jgi:hypothetical protein